MPATVCDAVGAVADPVPVEPVEPFDPVDPLEPVGVVLGDVLPSTGKRLLAVWVMLLVVILSDPSSHDCCSNSDIDAGAEAAARVNLGCGDRCQFRFGNDQLRGRRLCTGAGTVVLFGEGLTAERELKAVVGGF